MADISAISGIGDVYAEKLRAAGVNTTEDLLERGATRKGREELAAATDIESGWIMAWVNRADLFRIKGIGTEYSDLLEEAGVDTVPELARRNPDNLHAALEAIAAKKSLVRRLPTRDQVADWIEQAKNLPRAVEY
ncbi:MAG: DUF4332 domain-containing protein [Chloroflexi bacterium]|nr:DUF4332 domain-containing protein [Chloroflexota bacterium]